jgi:hypothetical protein
VLFFTRIGGVGSFTGDFVARHNKPTPSRFLHTQNYVTGARRSILCAGRV